MADRLAVDPDLLALMADMAVGVDLHLDAAIAEDALGDDGDHVHVVGLLRHDERRRLVVGIGGAGADGGDEGAVGLDDVAAPGFALARQKRHHLAAGGLGVLDDGERIDADQFAALVGVTVAGAALAVGDVAHHRAGVAADLALDRAGARLPDHVGFPYWLAARIAARTRSGVAGSFLIRAPVASRMALRIAGAVGISTCSPSPLAP